MSSASAKNSKFILLIITLICFANEGRAQVEVLKTVEGKEIRNLVAFKQHLYFTIDNQLWKVDSNSVPSVVSDVSSPISSIVYLATEDYLLFTIPVQEGKFELWRTDGTSSGTFLLSPIPEIPSAISGSGSQYYLLIRSGSGELWKTNFYPEGTKKILNGLTAFAFYQGKLFFIDFDNVKWYDETTETSFSVITITRTVDYDRGFTNILTTEGALYVVKSFIACCEPETYVYKITGADDTYSYLVLPNDVVRAHTFHTFKNYLIASCGQEFSSDPPRATRSIRDDQTTWTTLRNGDCKYFVTIGDYLYWGWSEFVVQSDGTSLGTRDLATRPLLGLGATDGYSTSTSYNYVWTKNAMYYTGTSNMHNSYVWRSIDGVATGIYKFTAPYSTTDRLYAANEDDLYIVDGSDILHYKKGMTAPHSLTSYLKSLTIEDPQQITYLSEKLFFTSNTDSKLVSYDLKQIISATVLKEEQSSFDIELFPNPSSVEIIILGPELAHILIFDIFGKCVASSEVTAKSGNIDIQHLPVGQYVLYCRPMDRQQKPTYKSFTIIH